MRDTQLAPACGGEIHGIEPTPNVAHDLQLGQRVDQGGVGAVHAARGNAAHVLAGIAQIGGAVRRLPQFSEFEPRRQACRGSSAAAGR